MLFIKVLCWCCGRTSGWRSEPGDFLRPSGLFQLHQHSITVLWVKEDHWFAVGADLRHGRKGSDVLDPQVCYCGIYVFDLQQQRLKQWIHTEYWNRNFAIHNDHFYNFDFTGVRTWTSRFKESFFPQTTILLNSLWSPHHTPNLWKIT